MSADLLLYGAIILFATGASVWFGAGLALLLGLVRLVARAGRAAAPRRHGAIR